MLIRARMHSSHSQVGIQIPRSSRARSTYVGTQRLRRARRVARARYREREERFNYWRCEDPMLSVRFGVRQRIGRGGCSEVLVTRDLASGSRVALKVLLPTLSDAAARDGAARMRREADVLERLALLAHPVLPRLYERSFNGECDPWLAMEFIAGPTLAERLEQSPIRTQHAIRWIRELADALDACHRIGVIHLDLKPANIILGSNIKLIDWGIAHDTAYDCRVTEIGMVAGTPRYMSPEQAQDHPTGPPSDVYSLGIVAYEILTGDAPFTGNSSVSIALRHVLEMPAPIAIPESPAGAIVAAMVMSMLEKHAALRPTMASIRASCDAALALLQ